MSPSARAFPEDPTDPRKNICGLVRYEVRHLGLQVAKQEEVTGCGIRRTSLAQDPSGFDSGHFLSRPFGIVSWRSIEMEVGTLKRLPTLALAEIPFDVRQNRCTKEFRIAPHPGRQSKKSVDARCQPNIGNQALLI
jgi:hypothetical protein